MTTSKVQADFDRLALLSDDEWSHNSHYHSYLLKHLPQSMNNALEIGCGKGEFARLLANRAERVLALDLSPQMIRIAKERSANYPNIQYQAGDVMTCELPENHYDCIVSIATLHHLPLEAMLLKMQPALKPGGMLLILDLYVLERWGWQDAARNLTAIPYNALLRLVKTGRLRQSSEVREAWAEHGKTDHYLSPEQIIGASAILPGARFKLHLFWRYSLIWTK